MILLFRHLPAILLAAALPVGPVAGALQNCCCADERESQASVRTPTCCEVSHDTAGFGITSVGPGVCAVELTCGCCQSDATAAAVPIFPVRSDRAGDDGVFLAIDGQQTAPTVPTAGGLFALRPDLVCSVAPSRMVLYCTWLK